MQEKVLLTINTKDFNPYLGDDGVNISFVNNIVHDCPFTLVYQNNQDRLVSLSTINTTIDIHSHQPMHFYVEDIVSFYWVNNENNMQVHLYPNGSSELARYWYLHIVLPIFYSLNGKYSFLHTGTVLVNNNPILFMADSFGGKSTITDYFMKKGHTLVTDDKLASYEDSGEFMAVPSIPYHRPYRKAEDLGHYVENFATKAYKMDIIYQLHKADSDAEILFTEVKGLEKFSCLHKGSEMNFGFNMKSHVPYLSRLANKIRLFKINMPWNLERQDEVYHAILNHLKKVQNAT